MNITIKKAETKKELKTFVKFAWKIYKGNPYWVPPLLIDKLSMVNREKHPFYKTAETEFFLAEKDGEIVGQIAAIHNRLHNEVHNEKTGFFGFFECINNQEVANKLFDTANSWLKERGLDTMRGPMNPSTNYEVGLLINAFDQSPQFMMTYNPEYYLHLCENYGMKKSKDLFAYYLKKETTLSDKLKRVTEIIQKRRPFVVRPVNMKDFDNEVKKIKEIYNDAWSKNWGFIPYTDEEFDYLAKDLKLIINPEYVLIAELDGKPIGFSLALPNINEILINIPSGKLLPTGIFKLLLGKKKIKTCRVITLGIKKDYQKHGYDAVLYYETWRRATQENNIIAGEASWILEDNDMMVRAAELMHGDLYRKYRIYEFPLK
jgi:GNAT superfamily N-acetyltransferase